MALGDPEDFTDTDIQELLRIFNASDMDTVEMMMGQVMEYFMSMHDDYDHEMPEYDAVAGFFLQAWGLELSEDDFNFMMNLGDPEDMSSEDLG